MEKSSEHNSAIHGTRGWLMVLGWFKQIPALFKRIRERGLVWWLVDMQRKWYMQIAAFFLFLVMFHLATFTWQKALVMVISMFLHELGHALVFKIKGIKFILLYLFPLGAVAAPSTKEEDARSDQLPWSSLAVLLLAGTTVNVTLIALGKYLATNSVWLHSLGEDLIYCNAIQLLMNTVPMWKLDAGQFVKLIYKSLTNKYDRLLNTIVTASVFALVGMTLFPKPHFELKLVLFHLLDNFARIVFAVMFVLGNWYTRRQTKPESTLSPQRMSGLQVVLLLLVYVAIVVISVSLI